LFYHLMLLNKVVPGVFKRVPIVDNFTLEDLSGKARKKYEFNTGFFEIFSLNIQDGGTHVGADVMVSLRPLTKSGSYNISADKASPRMLYFEYYGNQISQFRVDRFDLDNGVYTMTADFVGGRLPVLDPYELIIRYPAKTEVGDDTALSNYGKPVECTLEGFAYEIDLEKALEAETDLLAMGFLKALQNMKFNTL